MKFKEIIVLIFLGFANQVFCQTHSISFSAGYSTPWNNEENVHPYSRKDIRITNNERLIYEDIEHKFIEGVKLQVGYNYWLSKYWSFWSAAEYINGVGYETTLMRGPMWPSDNYAGIQHHTFESHNIAVKAGMAFSLNRKSKFYRNKISKRFYYQLRLGLSYNQPQIFTRSRSTPDSQFDVEADSKLKGYGVGANASLRVVYRLNARWELFLHAEAERMKYRATGISYDRKTFNGFNELDPPSTYNLPGTDPEVDFIYKTVVPLHSFAGLVGVSYNFGK